MSKLKQITDNMECNGYAYFNREAFANKTDEVCYVPENAEDETETYNYNRLKSLVSEWAKENAEYLGEHETDEDAILTSMYEALSWEFPETYLNELE